VYLAPYFAIRLNYSFFLLLQLCFIVLSKWWVNVVYIYIDYLYTALSFNIQTKECLINNEISTFWKVFLFNCIVKFSSKVMQAVHHYRIRPVRGHNKYIIYIYNNFCVLHTDEHTFVFVRLRKKYKSRSGMVFNRKKKKIGYGQSIFLLFLVIFFYLYLSSMID